MVKKVIWFPRAKDRYKRIIDFLLIEWGETAAVKFIEQVDQKLYLLARFPNLGIASVAKPNLRSLLLTKHNRLVYPVNEKEIHLHEIDDTRQAQ
ncbi:MAG: type II toxin-antitoxin system RelE/ParE family toxin [Bacteroidota bacterium]|jgi:plasmid stabilization system protein ParE|nr:type II toxin-antitoxin system RelE/ParE family toxin [Cytophagales bacterium]MCE2956776.1 type II toxin-antitoxin system RelE/ParE family toxin [Flammeovirgaceae bacterium]MCZ8069167.1 type II toxin-antitoxin system RelE/ParE family toxin [Cytophagales bacterium]